MISTHIGVDGADDVARLLGQPRSGAAPAGVLKVREQLHAPEQPGDAEQLPPRITPNKRRVSLSLNRWSLSAMAQRTEARVT